MAISMIRRRPDYSLSDGAKKDLTLPEALLIVVLMVVAITIAVLLTRLVRL